MFRERRHTDAQESHAQPKRNRRLIFLQYASCAYYTCTGVQRIRADRASREDHRHGLTGYKNGAFFSSRKLTRTPKLYFFSLPIHRYRGLSKVRYEFTRSRASGLHAGRRSVVVSLRERESFTTHGSPRISSRIPEKRSP